MGRRLSVCCNRKLFLFICLTFVAFMTFKLYVAFMNGVQIRQLIITNEELSTNPSKCKPVNYIFLLKTHKTGSTTLAEILYRYGDDRNLTFVLPAGRRTPFNWPQRFLLSEAIPLHAEEGKILNVHIRYNKGPVNLLFPKSKSKYITILRHPISQFESTWGFYRFTEILGLENDNTPIQSYLKNPTAFAERFRQNHPAMKHKGTDLKTLIRNPSMHDLGLDPKYFENRNAVMGYIKYIEEEFDLFLINEYYDESLILLKNLLCWDFDDILYLKQNVRTKKVSLDNESKANILSWSQADFLLYLRLNKTFWSKVSKAGPKFHDDLQLFREKRKVVEKACLQELEKGTIEVYRKEYYPNKYLQMCAQMAREIPRYLVYIKERMQEKWKIIDQSLFEDFYNASENSRHENQELKYKPVLIPPGSQ